MALAAMLALFAPATAEAQRIPPVPRSPVLTLDEDRFFADSRFGRRIIAEFEAAQDALALENRTIEARLAEEELSLTRRRPTMPPEAFRQLADDFDRRAEQIRRTQDGKSRDQVRRHDEERQRFLAATLPVLAALVSEAGAVVILSDQAIVMAFDRIDITDAAIQRLDEELGDGSDLDPAAE